jgi:hypothetical protein
MFTGGLFRKKKMQGDLPSAERPAEIDIVSIDIS